MTAIVCPFCAGETEMVPAEPGRVIEGDGVLAVHALHDGGYCRGSKMAVTAPLPPRDCTACGEPLSLAIRSRQAGIYSRQHHPHDCIAALRSRIDRLEAALNIASIF